MKIDIYCRVIDNFGDIGFSLRLARDLALFDNKITLYLDNFKALNKIVHKDDYRLISFKDYDDIIFDNDVDAVICTFCSHVSEKRLQSLVKNQTLIINLEYLTAQDFSKDFNKKRSYADNLNAYFYYPSFDDSCGFLVFEKSYKQKLLNAHDDINKKLDINKIANLDYIGTNENESFLINLFSYDTFNLDALIKSLLSSKKQFLINVFGHFTKDLIENYFKKDFHYSLRVDNIEFIKYDFVDQISFDDILLKANLNIIRGEDSQARAYLSGKPFLWNIYPQDEDEHINKLNAFYDKMQDLMGSKFFKIIDEIRSFNLTLEHRGEFIFNFDKNFTSWQEYAREHNQKIISYKSLSLNILDFINELKAK